MNNFSRPLDHGDPKTPMAWRHRDIIFLAAKPSQIPVKNYQSDPSLMSSISSGEGHEMSMARRNELKKQKVEKRQRKYLDTIYRDFTPALSHNEIKRFKLYRSGTLRSNFSVPSLNSNSWYGGTCPVHDHRLNYNHHPFRSYDSMLNLGDQEYKQRLPLDCKSISKRESKRFNQSKLEPPPLPPRVNLPSPVVSDTFFPGAHIPYSVCHDAAAITQYPARDVIMRDGQFFKSAVKFQEDPFDVKQVCCQGHIGVLWIILAIITCGVILGIMLGAIMA
ncbi:uncharacterized protein LOC143234185 [Tachypleus tridentatus]|uniref:uncharacterized protein LOC143234185 n=1 Tax=Tachypleus tridentatus TaxID=6853 RepID=UPI003FD3383C